MSQIKRVEHPEVQARIDEYYQEYLKIFEIAKTIVSDEKTAAQSVLKAIDDNDNQIRIKFNGCPSMMLVDYAYEHNLYEWGIAAKMFREFASNL